MNDVQVLASLRAVESKLESYKSEYESINHSINTFKVQIAELCNKTDVPAEYENFKLATQKFLSQLDGVQSSNRILIERTRADLDVLKNTVLIHEEKIRIAGECIPMLEQKIIDTKITLSEKIVSISTAFTNRFDVHAEQQKKQLEAFSNHAMSAPKSVIESNRSLLDQVELAKLDGANALLKASNIELSVKMLERKLENLTLQVKKSELSQQT